MNGHFESKPNRRMPNGTYGGVRGKGAKAKTLAPRPTRFHAGRQQLLQMKMLPHD